MGFSKRMQSHCTASDLDDTRSTCSDGDADVFRSVPKNSTIFCIWKIEGLKAVGVSRNKMGTFLTESAYIVYAVSSKDGPLPYPGIPVKEIKGSADAVVRTVHFWIGAQCDQTVSGAAALRAAELDSQISATILIREAQGRESPRFLAYFRQELVIQHFHPDPPFCTMHRVSGIATPVLTELDGIRWENFSSRDVILIEIQSRDTIFLWLGSASTPLHKRHAARVLESRKELQDHLRIVVLEDGYERSLRPEDLELFQSILDPSSRAVVPDRVRTPQTTPGVGVGVRLYRCSEQAGKYKVAEVKSGPVFRTDLSPGSVYLLDRGTGDGVGIGVWAWVGRQVSARERLEAVRNARGFVKKKGYPVTVGVGRALEDAEPLELRSLLRARGQRVRTLTLTLPGRFEPEYMHERPRLAAECQLLDDGSGESSLWSVSRTLGARSRDPRKGVFFSEACYVLRYRYGSGRRSRTVVYCWDGAHSASVDRQAALAMACELAEAEECAQLVKAAQGREPPHLLQIYNGKLTILMGPHRESLPSRYLLRVFGSTPYTSKAVERPLRASSLDSSGVFVLFSENNPVVWCGGRSTGDAREASRRLAPGIAPLVLEGKEDEDFWEELGGKSGYGNEASEDPEDLEKHLYHCRLENDTFCGEEVLGFSQATLLPEAAWLLDAGTVVWVWLGENSSFGNLQRCVEAGTSFVCGHPAGRDRNTTVSVIRQGFEPVTFVGLFEDWSHNLLRDHRPFETLRMLLQDREPSSLASSAGTPTTPFDGFAKYPLKLLRAHPEELPTGVDVARKELHLTHDDFIAVFRMEPGEFEKLPTWRKQRLKQNAGLF